ncbi:MAG TPA: hypothetical protein VL091_11790 [Marinobacter sp.]|nr:hypothetical protein [Marinobacter sp.]
MAYKLNVFEDGLIANFTGTVTSRMIEACDQEISSKKGFSNSRYIIYNFLGCDTSSANLDEAYEFGVKDAARSYENKNLRMAVITKDPDFIILAESYKKMGAMLGSGWKIKVVETMDDAKEWCQVTSEC